MSNGESQPELFDSFYSEQWRQEWDGMPDFDVEDLSPWKMLKVNFASPDDYREFQKLIGQKLTEKTISIWYPENEKVFVRNSKRYRSEQA